MTFVRFARAPDVHAKVLSGSKFAHAGEDSRPASNVEVPYPSMGSVDSDVVQMRDFYCTPETTFVLLVRAVARVVITDSRQRYFHRRSSS